MSSEEAYRRHFLAEDAIQAAIAMAVISVAQVLFLWNDHALFGFEDPFPRLLLCRSLMLVGGVALAVYQYRPSTPHAHDRRLTAWLILFTLGLVYVNSTRPPDFIGHGAPTAVLVVALYCMIPGALGPRAIAALAISFGTFVFSMSAVASVIGRNALLLTHVAVHVVGLLIGLRMIALRKRTFATHEELVEKARALEVESARSQELARVKSAFLATMSHELRTPMNAVMGISELLTRSPLTVEQRSQARAIHDSARGLLVVLNDILDMAKVEAGRMTVTRAPVELRSLVSSAEQLFRAEAKARDLRLTVDVHPDVPDAVLGDAARISQVLANLISNAIKFTEAGFVEVEVSARVTSERCTLVVEVTDSGPGIPEALRARLFQPFEQASETGGTGLGLAISKRLAEAMGGTLELVSPAGTGACFVLELPTEVATVAPVVAAPEATGPTPSLRILVADDNAMNRRVAVAMLKHLGYVADVVEDGAAAVAAVEATTYDLVFLDLRMPKLDGFEAARAISARGSGPRLIALTASTFAEDRAACLATGMADVITKPMQLADLQRAIAAMAVDRTFLDKLRQLETASNAAGFVADLCTRFLTDTPLQLDALATAVASAKVVALEHGAHTLKSAAAFLGAVRFARVCGEIEEIARRGVVEGCESRLADLRAELVRVKAALVELELRDLV